MTKSEIRNNFNLLCNLETIDKRLDFLLKERNNKDTISSLCLEKTNFTGEKKFIDIPGSLYKNILDILIDEERNNSLIIRAKLSLEDYD